MANFKFSLGNKLEDIVTGVIGICVGRIEYLNGCLQYCIKQPVGKDGKVIEGNWIDENQLKLLKGGIKVEQKDGGGPSPDAPRL
jgi:hypothetical protein